MRRHAVGFHRSERCAAASGLALRGAALRSIATLSSVARSFVVGAAAMSLALFATRAAAAAASTRPILEALDVASVPCLNRDGLGAQLRTWLRRDEIDSRISIVVRPGAGEASGPSVSFFILRDGRPVV